MARPLKDPTPLTAGGPGRQLPAPKAILEREARQRKVAIWSAVALALLTAVAVIVERLMNGSVPELGASTLIDTFGAAASGTAFPPSQTVAAAQWKLDHVAVSVLAGLLRSATYLLVIPVALFLLRGARDRGGALVRPLDLSVVIGCVLIALGPIVFALGEPGVYGAARDAGLSPGSVRDAVDDSSLIYVQIPVLFGSLMVGIPLAFGAMQAYRTGLLPTLLGFMGVLIGITFVMPLDPTGLVRAFWFSMVAFFIAGRFGGGLSEAWTTGLAVAPQPRQPPAPREKKAKEQADA